jgi:hypothetical protein
MDQDAIPMIVGKKNYDRPFRLRYAPYKKKEKKNDHSQSEYPGNQFPLFMHNNTSYSKGDG